MRINNTDVLFQKVGPAWFVFAEIEGEVVYTSLPHGINPLETSFEFYQVIEDYIESAKLRQRLVAEGGTL